MNPQASKHYQKLIDLADLPSPIDPADIDTIKLSGSIIILTLKSNEEIIIPNTCISWPKRSKTEEDASDDYISYKITCPVHGTIFDAKTGNPIDIPEKNPEGLRAGIIENHLYLNCPLMHKCWKIQTEAKTHRDNDIIKMISEFR